MNEYKTLFGKDEIPAMRGGGRGTYTKKHCWDIIIVAQRGRGKGKTSQKLEINNTGNTNTLTGVQKDNLVIQINPSTESGGVQPFQQNRIYDADGIVPALPAQMSSGTHAIQVKSATKNGFEEAKEGDSINLSMPKSKTRRGRVGVGVAQTIDTQANQSVLLKGKIRRLTEIECERLQGFPDNWTKYGNYDGAVREVSRTQRYKLCGNAVTKNIVEMIGRKLLS